MQQASVMESVSKLELLETRIKLNLSLDDLRIIIGCLRAIEYQMKIDDEPYLDTNGLALKSKLETFYKAMLEKLGL
jgi:hypothetical protein